MEKQKDLGDKERKDQKFLFLSGFFKDVNFSIEHLPADASFRKYDRVVAKEKSFILMDAPVEHYSLVPFIEIAIWLKAKGFSAPEIYHIDHESGFLLLEDFGKVSLSAHLLSLDHEAKFEVYKLIVDLLVKLQSFDPVDLKSLSFVEHYSNKILLKELEIYTDWYIPYIKGKPLSEDLKSEFLQLWSGVLDEQPDLKKHSLLLRDYHVDNMMLLHRNGIQSIGLLDFQDALIGSPIYDLVSVLEDARCDLSAEFGRRCLDYYLGKNLHFNKNDAYLSYHILGAQRNSRILGVFARKAIRDNATSYLQYIPRVSRYLEHDLSHEKLSGLKLWMQENL